MRTVCRKLFSERVLAPKTWDFILADQKRFAKRWKIDLNVTPTVDRVPLIENNHNVALKRPYTALESVNNEEFATNFNFRCQFKPFEALEAPIYHRPTRVKAKRRLPSGTHTDSTLVNCNLSNDSATLTDYSQSPPSPPKKLHRSTVEQLCYEDLIKECNSAMDRLPQIVSSKRKQKTICELFQPNKVLLCNSSNSKRARMSEPLPKRHLNARLTDYYQVKRFPSTMAK